MELLVDAAGGALWFPPDPYPVAGAQVPAPAQYVGFREVVPIASRMVWATLSGRYHPSHAPGDACLFGIDMSLVLLPGSYLVTAAMQVFVNAFVPTKTDADFEVGPVTIAGRRAWVPLFGGVDGTDYRLVWSFTDSDDNIWNRTTLVLCSPTN